MKMMTSVSTKCQQNLQLYKGNGSLFTNLLFAFFSSFCLWDRFLFFNLKSLRCVFFQKKITQTQKIKEITFHMPGNFSFPYREYYTAARRYGFIFEYCVFTTRK